MAKKKNGSRYLALGLLLLLVAGLSGLGARNFGGRIKAIGSVGETQIPVDAYYRALNGELRALSSQSGRNVSLSEARQFGLDRTVLQRLVAATALQEEARRIGVSVGDEELRRRLMQSPEFQGPDGKFDKETYTFVLERNGLKPGEYEDLLRSEIATDLLRKAISQGAELPPEYADTIISYLGERRSFAVAELDESALPAPIAEPTDEELRSYYEASQDKFMLPATKRITYVWLNPENLLDQVEVAEEDIRALYESRADKYNQPERRLLERLVFPDMASAQAAADAIASGEKSFEDVVAERGLKLSDIDMGDVARDDLGAEGDAIFGRSEPGIVGPLQTDLGPALFRINAVLQARKTPYEAVRDDLRKELAISRARDLVAERLSALEDALAGGATLEDLAKEQGLELGQIDWIDGQSKEGIAAYEAFDTAARKATRDDFPSLESLPDGGVFALRVDEEVPAHPEPFEQAREKVAAALRHDRLIEALTALAETFSQQLQDGTDISSLGFPVAVYHGKLRAEKIKDMPDGLLPTVFKIDAPGKAVPFTGTDKAYIVQLREITPADPQDPDMQALKRAVVEDAKGGLGQDMLAAYVRDIELEAGISLNQSAIEAVHAQFP